MKGVVAGHSLYLETKDGSLIALDPGRPDSPDDVVALVASGVREGMTPWESQAPATELAAALSEKPGVTAHVLLSRSPEPFVGYYVRIRQ